MLAFWDLTGSLLSHDSDKIIMTMNDKEKGGGIIPVFWVTLEMDQSSSFHYTLSHNSIKFCWSVAEIFHLRAKYGGNTVPLETKMMAKMIVMEWFDSYHYI